ncbi:hypothetical protein FA95DRAFT_1577429 [Auriscalpium vulgare]|uniref:Uncharacterized protein n=1 Tax=Auriscalpium vulgare TaxID=40419 RepID=A0ACB8R6W6_9AGAM|nr:hypothetical protein FA95DRAFT_1577429 [Auriscalpium vulgare]
MKHYTNADGVSKRRSPRRGVTGNACNQDNEAALYKHPWSWIAADTVWSQFSTNVLLMRNVIWISEEAIPANTRLPAPYGEEENACGQQFPLVKLVCPALSNASGNSQSLPHELARQLQFPNGTRYTRRPFIPTQLSDAVDVNDRSYRAQPTYWYKGHLDGDEALILPGMLLREDTIIVGEDKRDVWEAQLLELPTHARCFTLTTRAARNNGYPENMTDTSCPFVELISSSRPGKVETLDGPISDDNKIQGEVISLEGRSTPVISSNEGYLGTVNTFNKGVDSTTAFPKAGVTAPPILPMLAEGSIHSVPRRGTELPPGAPVLPIHRRPLSRAPAFRDLTGSPSPNDKSVNDTTHISTSTENGSSSSPSSDPTRLTDPERLTTCPSTPLFTHLQQHADTQLIASPSQPSSLAETSGSQAYTPTRTVRTYPHNTGTGETCWYMSTSQFTVKCPPQHLPGRQVADFTLETQAVVSTYASMTSPVGLNCAHISSWNLVPGEEERTTSDRLRRILSFNLNSSLVSKQRTERSGRANILWSEGTVACREGLPYHIPTGLPIYTSGCWIPAVASQNQTQLDR